MTQRAKARADTLARPEASVAVLGREYQPAPFIKGRKPARTQRAQRRFWRLIALGVRPA